MDTESRRETLRGLFGVALAAVDPEKLTRETLKGPLEAPVTLIAIGKAATAMCRGASRRIQGPRGICVTDAPNAVPEGIELLIGDHPIPGDRSLRAGRRVLEVARRAPGRIIALISGGGSALCEHPIDGVSPRFVGEATEVLLSSGASIAEINLVRRHLSAIKGGGLARVAGGPIDTYAISDVCGEDPSVIASGPTVPAPPDPGTAIAIMLDHGLEVPSSVQEAIRNVPTAPDRPESIRVIADGHTATLALARQARSQGLAASVLDGWLRGPISDAFDDFMKRAGPGLTIATGEPDVFVAGNGRGGRNTHVALLAATRLTGTNHVFAAFATDGVDGSSSSAGAIVDGKTVDRGGDPQSALARFDSASYLAASGDLVDTGPTGTNVSDLWLMWK